MKCLDFKQQQSSFICESTNGIIKVNIVDLHPEFTLEDNSMLIFPNTNSYYDFISNGDLFSMHNNDINIENLFKNMNIIDTVNGVSYMGQDINTIFEITYNNQKIYYIQRGGINKIASI